MTERFADSFVFLALINGKDRRHLAAIDALDKSREPLVTTAWVLAQLADGLCAARTRTVFVMLEAKLRNVARIAIIPCTDRLYEAGLELYRQRPDKDWSPTDCISFVVMRERGIVETWTGDHHFEQAGFLALLK